MKALSIGRDMSCDIVLHDNTDVISRRHAILNITSTGKMTIVDQSHNGTYVNGIKISANVPVPVTRKDVISFAHVVQLDWSLVPRTNSLVIYGAIALGVVLVILCFVSIPLLFPGGGNKPDVNPVVNTPDTTTIKKNSETPKEVECEKDADSEKDKEASDKKPEEKKDSNKVKQKKENKQPERQESSKKNDAENKDSVSEKQRPIGI